MEVSFPEQPHITHVISEGEAENLIEEKTFGQMT